MGWWKVEGTEIMLGDRPLDALGQAIKAVLDEYRTALHRRPTSAEWEALLAAALGAEEAQNELIDGGERDGRTVRELGGEVFAELARLPDEQLGWQTKNQVVDIVMGVLARHVDARLRNDTDLPVEPLGRMPHSR